jgi:hypothetical protein
VEKDVLKPFNMWREWLRAESAAQQSLLAADVLFGHRHETS